MPRFSEATIETPLARGVTRAPGRQGGEPCLAGTRFPTRQLWSMVVMEGLTEEEVRGPGMFPHLTAKQVKQGLDYERRERRKRKRWV